MRYRANCVCEGQPMLAEFGWDYAYGYFFQVWESQTALEPTVDADQITGVQLVQLIEDYAVEEMVYAYNGQDVMLAEITTWAFADLPI